MDMPFDEMMTLVSRCRDPQMPAEVRQAAAIVDQWLMGSDDDDGDEEIETDAELRQGIPPLALRRVWPRWVDADGDILLFTANGTLAKWEDEEVCIARDPQPAEMFDGGTNSFAPDGATWAYVESLAGGEGRR